MHIQNLVFCVALLHKLFLSEKYQVFCVYGSLCKTSGWIFFSNQKFFQQQKKGNALFLDNFITCNLHSIQLFGSFIPDQLSGIFCAGQGFNHFAFLCFRNWREVHLQEEFPAIIRLGSNCKYGFHNITRQTTRKNKNNKTNKHRDYKNARLRKEERSHKIKILTWRRCLSLEQFDSVAIVKI